MRPRLSGRWLKSALRWLPDRPRALEDSPRLLPDGHKGTQDDPRGRREHPPRPKINHFVRKKVYVRDAVVASG
eukprot:4687787-Pyramimonas_sp.AAC.1